MATERHEDEWRIEVKLETEEHHKSLGERLRSLDIDDEARKRLGGSVIVTRDGPHMFLYAWHEQSAREAEIVVRDLLAEEGFAGEVSLMRWHPAEDTWKPASVPLPATEDQEEAEAERREAGETEEAARTGEYEWQVMVELPSVHATRDYARELHDRGLPVKRRWKYLLVGAATEDAAVELGQSLEAGAPKGSKFGVRANPDDFPLAVFVQLGSHKPGVMRDLGL